MNPQQVFDQYSKDPGHDMYEYLEFIRQVSFGSVLEIGVRGGVSTAAFLLSRATHVWSVDTDYRCADLYPDNPKWTFIHENSRNDMAVSSKGSPIRVNTLMIDGDHSYEGLLSDLMKYVRLVSSGGLVLVHDVNPLNMCSLTAQQVEQGWPGSYTSRAWNDFLAVKNLWSKSRVLPGKFGMGVIQL